MLNEVEMPLETYKKSLLSFYLFLKKSNNKIIFINIYSICCTGQEYEQSMYEFEIPNSLVGLIIGYLWIIS